MTVRRYRVLAAVSLLLLPVVLRGLWFYRGLYRPAGPVAIPSFTEIRPPLPPPAEPTAAAAPEAATGKVVVLDQAHDNRFRLPELEPLIQALLTRGAHLETVEPGDEFESPGFGSPDALYAFGVRSLQTRLKYAGAYVVVAPLSEFSEVEVQHVARFVARGGRLLVILDPTRAGGGIDLFGSVLSGLAQDVSNANRLLEPHDLSFRDDYLYDVLQNEGNFRNVLLTPADSDRMPVDASRVVFYAARSVVTRQGSPVLVGDRTTVSSKTDRPGPWAAAALSPDGRVLAVGDLTFMTPPYDRVAGNQRFIQSMTDFLLAGQRQQDLTDLPYLFSRPVAVLTSPAFSVQSETLQAVRALQSALSTRGLELTLSSEPGEGSDVLILSLFEPSEQTAPYLEGFELRLPADPPDASMLVPGFGEFDPTGIGVMAALREEQRTTLLLMAGDREDLSLLAENVGRGVLSDCVFQGQYALCKLGEGAGFESTMDPAFDLDFVFDEAPVEFPPTVPAPP